MNMRVKMKTANEHDKGVPNHHLTIVAMRNTKAGAKLPNI